MLLMWPKRWHKYPQSLQDVIEGHIIGTAYFSLTKQIQNRVENVKLPSTPKITNRNNWHSSDTEEIPEKWAAIQDTYGCINWHVMFLPLGETAKNQQQKKEKLKSLFRQSDQSPAPVKLLMKSTFYTQRQEVNNAKDVKHLVENWPYWFTEIGMAVHFSELTGVELLRTPEDLPEECGTEEGKALALHENCCCEQKQKILSSCDEATADEGRTHRFL